MSHGTERAAKAPRDGDALAVKIGYLSGSEIFADLNAEQLEAIGRSAVMRTCEAGRVLYTPGETGEVMFILKTGAVETYRMSPEGRKLVTATLRPFAFFGEMSVLGQGMYNSFAEAIEESRICVMSRADVERLVLSHPPVVLRILKTLGQRMVQLERTLDDVAFRGLVPRVSRLILEEMAGDSVEGLSHQAMADRLGVYRESVTVALRELKEAGVIEIGRKRIRVASRRSLEELAGH